MFGTCGIPDMVRHNDPQLECKMLETQQAAAQAGKLEVMVKRHNKQLSDAKSRVKGITQQQGKNSKQLKVYEAECEAAAVDHQAAQAAVKLICGAQHGEVGQAHSGKIRVAKASLCTAIANEKKSSAALEVLQGKLAQLQTAIGQHLGKRGALEDEGEATKSKAAALQSSVDVTKRDLAVLEALHTEARKQAVACQVRLAPAADVQRAKSASTGTDF